MLINQGKFRERANRSKRYKGSENHIAQLIDHTYDHHHTVKKPLPDTDQPVDQIQLKPNDTQL
ncbi:hypothetical protein I2F27_02200 [Acinetobacter sp. B5B]|nr:hypothetical protein [Acinetobacter baretiae]